MRYLKPVSILLIFAAGLLLRILLLHRITPGIDWDEASFAYNAFSIASWGRDEWGKSLPLLFQAFGDAKLPVYIYLTAPLIKILGLSVFSVRLISALLGATSVLLIYKIARELFSERKIPLLSAIFLAFSAYGIFYSRLALDIGVISFFLLGGILFELKYVNGGKFSNLLISTIFLLVAFFSYNIGRIMSPLFIFLFMGLNIFVIKERLSKYAAIFALVSIVFTIGILQANQGGLVRLKYMGIFGESKSVQLEINEFRQHDDNNVLSRILHNKVTFYTLRLIENYTRHFSLRTLSYATVPQSVQVSFRGPLYPLQVPFYYAGILFLISSIRINQINKRGMILKIIILFWVLIAPLPSTITEGEIHRRYLGGLGSWELLSAWGTVKLLEKIRNKEISKIIIATLLCIYTFYVFSFIRYYFNVIPSKHLHTYFFRQNFVAKQAIEEHDRYKNIYISKKITAEPHIFLLFHSKQDPALYQQIRRSRTDNGVASVTGYGKYNFPDSITQDLLSKLVGQKGVKIYLTGEEVFLNNKSIKENNLKPKKIDITNEIKQELFTISL